MGKISTAIKIVVFAKVLHTQNSTVLGITYFTERFST